MSLVEKINGRTIPILGRRINLGYKTGLIFTIMMSGYFMLVQVFFAEVLHYRAQWPAQLSYGLWWCSFIFMVCHVSKKNGWMPAEPWKMPEQEHGEPGVILYVFFAICCASAVLIFLAGLLQLINYWRVI